MPDNTYYRKPLQDPRTQLDNETTGLNPSTQRHVRTKRIKDFILQHPEKTAARSQHFENSVTLATIFNTTASKTPQH